MFHTNYKFKIWLTPIFNSFLHAKKICVNPPNPCHLRSIPILQYYQTHRTCKILFYD